MRRIPLTQFVAERKQTKSAMLLGMSQGALNKALRSGREIRVTEHDDGTFSAEEVKPFPSQAAKQQGEVRPEDDYCCGDSCSNREAIVSPISPALQGADSAVQTSSAQEARP